MSEEHKLTVATDAGSFDVRVYVNDDGDCEVVFWREARPGYPATSFRTSSQALGDAIAFVERHADINLVDRETT